MDGIISTNNISMEYKIKGGTYLALKDINIEIVKGQIVGIIGSNGAGKSTLIKILTGVLKPSVGSVIVNDHIPWKLRNEFKKEIGIVFGQRSQLWWELPVIDSFNVHQIIYGKTEEYTRLFLEKMDKVTNIKELLKKPVRNLSLGQRMLCDIILSLYHNPEVLFLDEPTIGLDTNVKSNIRELIKEINKNYNTTILLTSHDLADIQETCDRVILLDRGEKLYDSSLNDFITQFDNSIEIYVTSKNEEDPNSIIANAPFNNLNLEIKNSFEFIVRFNKEGNNLYDFLSFLSKSIEYADLKISGISIEEIVKNIYLGEIK